MTDEIVDVKGLTCPAPLIEARKKINKMQIGQTMEVIGDHAPSRIEVPEVMEDLGHEIVSVTDDQNGFWHVIIKKKN